MKKFILILRTLLLWFVPYRHCNLYVPLALENLKQILIDLSSTEIIEKSIGLFGGNTLYFVKIINDNCFQIDGPVGYKRFRLLTKGRIISNMNTSDELILELRIRPANQEILIFRNMYLILFFIIILGFIFSLPNLILIGGILVILVSPIWYVGLIINILIESKQIMKILRHKFQSQ